MKLINNIHQKRESLFLQIVDDVTGQDLEQKKKFLADVQLGEGFLSRTDDDVIQVRMESHPFKYWIDKLLDKGYNVQFLNKVVRISNGTSDPKKYFDVNLEDPEITVHDKVFSFEDGIEILREAIEIDEAFDYFNDCTAPYHELQREWVNWEDPEDFANLNHESDTSKPEYFTWFSPTWAGVIVFKWFEDHTPYCYIFQNLYLDDVRKLCSDPELKEDMKHRSLEFDNTDDFQAGLEPFNGYLETLKRQFNSDVKALGVPGPQAVVKEG